MQNKSWGIVITWKYQQAPYLGDKFEILSQMQTVYECGAKYIVLFNYYGVNANVYGTMEQQHFDALQTFWQQTVLNPNSQ
jgi:hypothetical protein